MSKEVMYNFQQFDAPSVSRRTLRKGQAKLYDLIVKKVDDGGTITLSDARKIWLNDVCRNMINGIPHTGTWVSTDFGAAQEMRPMSDDFVDFTVMNWTMRTIGYLVMRGYIKTIPVVRLV